MKRQNAWWGVEVPRSSGQITRRNLLVAGGVAAATGAGFLGVREALGDSTAARHAGAGSAHGAGHQSSSPSTAVSPSASQANTADVLRWSDPATWPDGVPAVGAVVAIDRPIILDEDADVGALTVGVAGSLTFDPEASRTLTSAGNIVVQGELVMRPADAANIHSIVFSDVDEHAFVGGGTVPLDTDIGLWIMGDGVLDIAGTRRLGWARAAGTLRAGTSTIELADEPVGWRAGDEIVVTPTAPPTGESSEPDFETVTIESVSGREVRLAENLGRDHPAVTLGDGRVMTAEVLNLTRNVRIEGTAEGRAHVMVHSAQPQSVRFASFRHLGPRHPAEEYTEGVLGRYALHFHICENGSRGSTVEGAVVRDAGNHAFVPHLSHGVSFRDCVSFNTYDDAYWWDRTLETGNSGPPTHDTTYERCVAALVKFDPDFRGYRLTGFALGRGRGNVARECVAVGILGNVDASGFHWPEGSEGIWLFENCVAHNSLNGIFVWHNTAREHVIADFVAYHNDGYGIDHGAYGNPYHFRDSVLHGNAGGAILLHATSRDAGLRFTNVFCDGAGRSDFLVEAADHAFGSDQPTRFAECAFVGARTAVFGLVAEGGERDLLEVVDCTFDGNEFWLADRIDRRSQVHVRDSAHGSIVLRRRDLDGELRPEWNARVTFA